MSNKIIVAVAIGLITLISSLFTASSLLAQQATPDQYRWILLGDSIHAKVFGTNATAQDLTSHLVQSQRNVVMQNISTGGGRIQNNGTQYWAAESNLDTLNMIDGFFGAKGLIITLGTNDFSSPNPDKNYYNDYVSVINRANQLGMEVICVGPITRSDANVPNAIGWKLLNYSISAKWACDNTGNHYINPAYAGLNLSTDYADGLHLNKAGHAKFSAWLINSMTNLGFW